MVIPIIAFIERGIRIPMGTVTRDYLRVHRLVPTQCALNMFRILGGLDALKTKYPEVRLISCLPESNKGMNKDILIVSGEWHDGLPYPTREGKLGGVFRSRFITSKSPFFPFDIFCTHFLHLCL